MKGNVEKLFDKITYDSGFEKRELLLRTYEKYPQLLKIEFTKEAINKLDGIKEGDTVEVQFNIRGSEYKGKYYVSLQGWALKKEDGSHSTTEPNNNIDEDGLPF